MDKLYTGFIYKDELSRLLSSLSLSLSHTGALSSATSSFGFLSPLAWYIICFDAREEEDGPSIVARVYFLVYYNLLCARGVHAFHTLCS